MDKHHWKSVCCKPEAGIHGIFNWYVDVRCVVLRAGVHNVPFRSLAGGMSGGLQSASSRHSRQSLNSKLIPFTFFGIEMNKMESQEYKQAIANLYSRRSETYDNSEWHDRMARRLVYYANIAAGSKVLDIATGTGMVAFYAAAKVERQGSVIGIDISEGMIEIAKSKLKSSEMPNVRFALGDGENLDFEENSFDYILCGSAFIWMSDIESALAHWRTRLKEGGKVGFHAFSESAFVAGVTAQSVLQKYGVCFLMSKPTGSVDKCKELLKQAGYRNIDIKIDSDGSYIDLAEAKNLWVSASNPTPGQFPHPMAEMTPEQLFDAHADFERELEKLNSEHGIWNDMTTFHVFGEK